jgi:hypothetical protein
MMPRKKSDVLDNPLLYFFVFLFLVLAASVAYVFSSSIPGLHLVVSVGVVGIMLISVICLCKAFTQSESKPPLATDVPKEYQSVIPKGLYRLQMSESQKTKSAGHIHRRPIPGVLESLRRIDDIDVESATKRPTTRKPAIARTIGQESHIRVLRGGEFIGNRMRFKVKVVNDSQYVITDVTIFLLSYPRDALKFAGKDDSVSFAKIEPGGLLSPTFDFLPTQDCVKGEIVAGVSFLDMQGNPQMRNTKPFIIRSVCDLLLPSRISPKDFELKLRDLECGEVSVKIEEWTPEEMFEKALRIVDESNFFEVSSKIEESDGIAFAKIEGFAIGKYTNKEVGVEIDITGPARTKGASCKIKVSGEDKAMILPAIDDLRERLNAWLCPMCSSPLSLAQVEDLKEGKAVVCPFCGVTIGR